MAIPTASPAQPRLAPTHLVGGAADWCSSPLSWSRTCCARPRRRRTRPQARWPTSTPPTRPPAQFSLCCSCSPARDWSVSPPASPTGCSSNARGPAIIGLVGAAGACCLFSTMLTTDLAVARLVAAGVRGDALLAAWTLHQAAFCVLLFAIAVALAGPVRSGHRDRAGRARLAPRRRARRAAAARRRPGALRRPWRGPSSSWRSWPAPPSRCCAPRSAAVRALPPAGRADRRRRDDLGGGRWNGPRLGCRNFPEIAAIP